MATDPSSLKIRTLFISDLHLGFRLAKTEACLEMLLNLHPQRLFLIGDTIDAWRLVRNWNWSNLYSAVISQMVTMQESGVDVRVCPGNHDDCFRDEAFTGGSPANAEKQLYDAALPILRLPRSESFIHETLTGKRLLVTHGDLFDDVRQRTAGMSDLGRRVFDRYSWILPDTLCHQIRRLFKRLLARPDKIENRLIEAARKQNLDGIVYGHIHKPCLYQNDGFIVANTGDWVENESLLVEFENGKLTLLNFGKAIATIDP